jgi:hypothetical protein
MTWLPTLIHFGGYAMIVFTAVPLLLTGPVLLTESKHAAELNLIWYINSLFFLVFYVLSVAAGTKGIELTAFCGPYQSFCDRGYKALTDVGEEVALVFVVSALVVVPQAISYFLSGLTGAALTPKFIGLVRAFAVWSLIKFLAALGGIKTAEALAQMTLSKPTSVADLFTGPITTGLALSYAGFYCWHQNRRRGYIRKPIRMLTRKLQRVATRNLPKERSRTRLHLVEVHINLPELSQLGDLTDRVRVVTHFTHGPSLS